MTASRRAFGGSVAAATMALPATAASAPPAGTQRTYPDDAEELIRHMRQYLSTALGNPVTAEQVVLWLFDIGFSWQPPAAELDTFDFIIGYSFGGWPPPDGGDPTAVMYEPGPVNAALATTIAMIRARRQLTG